MKENKENLSVMQKDLSKYMSYLLRHHPEDLDLKMNKQGWVLLDELYRKIRQSRNDFKDITMDDINYVVENNNKKRFAIQEFGHQLYIRASQGHSIDFVDLQFEAVVPPDILYHGTATRNIDSIMKKGLLKMERQFVHLSADYNTAINVGSRYGKPVVFEVDTKKMTEDGVVFYLSANNVWLTDYVDSKYLTLSASSNK